MGISIAGTAALALLLLMQDSSANSTIAVNRTKYVDLTRINWAHAVNSKNLLLKSLKDYRVDMIEADVVLGTINGSGPIIPIMAHPPHKTSDLSLQHFIKNITDYNTHAVIKKKGIKLDFKQIGAFLGSASTMQTIYSTIRVPFWLNADILSGPTTDNRNGVPVDPDQFLLGAKNYTNAVLSLGWTTSVNSTKRITYTDAQISEMHNVLKKHAIRKNVTFAVRAGVAAESIPQMKRLVTWPNSTLTIWLSNSSDPVSVFKLKRLVNEIGRNRTYLDLPESLKRKVISSASSLSYSFLGILLAIVLFIFNKP